MLNQSTTTAVLRIAVHSSRSAAIGTKITRATATPAASFSTFSTTSKHASQTVASRPICLFQTRTTTSNNARTRRLPGAPQPRGCTLSPILKQARFASTSSTATSTSATSPNTTEPSDQTLTWNQFFTLRKTRRRIQVIFSLLGAVGCGAAGSFTLATGLAEPLVTLIPLDPFITMGLMAFASALLGWLLGPSLGGGVFYMWHRRIRPQMTAKERQFFARIKKHRVDPSTSSVGNPVPDFYGEKISSVKGYRQWLKDQRAYNKKRTTFL